MVTCFLLQQTSDNAEMVKEMERRVWSLSGVLDSPVSENDYAEKGRRVVLRRSVSCHTNECQFVHPSFRKLEVVIARLEPLSNQHAIIGFLHNINDAKALAGSVQELADAITEYQVCATFPTMILN